MLSLRKKRKGKLSAATPRVTEITKDTRRAMWELFSHYYKDVDRFRFFRDLENKSHVILLRDEADDSLQGFSTLKREKHQIQDRDIVSIFTGDTVIHKDYWGQSALSKTFFVYLLQTKLLHPKKPVFWFLVSKGYKTYLTLARNIPDYWPRHDAQTPAFENEIIDHLSLKFFGETYQPESGLLIHENPSGRLSEDVAPVKEKDLSDPDIRFFADNNPDYSRGNELCCLGEINPNLVRYFTTKHLRRALNGRRR
ncbi:hypothetical protein KAI87_10500 [Myxococcota bacterium]|nr:hypothetical protein [Myxococcota bacterium]